MNKLSGQQIRDTWLNFFKERGHMIEPGASLVPNNDPTLLWINAGVAALKKYFDGSEIPTSKRITNVQKCIRTNDISNVGKTARHQTFFEMLGNFSIGDYFRKEVIEWAFDILTNPKYFGIEKEKLYITYHPTDLEAYEYWQKVGMDKSHLVALEGNFWQIGEGPCGPNTEVFFDRGEKWDPEHKGIELLEKDLENDRYIEIWGIVFSQYNAQAGVKREDYKELPHKNIDTGAGLERIACVLQETDTNFETDLFLPIIKATEKMAKVPYAEPNLMPYRVIADHIRTCTFALSDGALFSNEGRGYVLRRLLRRAMRYGQKIGFTEPFLYKLVPSVLDVMDKFYPYLREKAEMVERLIKIEEEKFLKTLTAGENILLSMIDGKTELSGEDAFKLYDTYGFPIELTEEICEDKGVKTDIETFKKCLEAQKELARNSRKVLQSFNKQSADLLDFTKPSEFTYDTADITSKVIGLFKDGVAVNEIEEEGDVVFDLTNFYAEMGGEVADTGTIKNDDVLADVVAVMKAPNKQHLHHVNIKYGTIKIGDSLTLSIDKIRRHNIAKNHSATHLLQSALIEVLGDEVRQKGSFVNDEYLRFDFSYFKKVEENDLKKVETLVNEYINESIDRVTLELPLEEAKKTGALAEFGEKYGELVRVVKFGDTSVEFCGGCHVSNSTEIGLFVIESEESISSGVRRIQALTGKKAYLYLKQHDHMLTAVKDALGVSSIKDAEAKAIANNELIAELNGKIKEYNKKACLNLANSLKTQFVETNGVNLLVARCEGMNKDSLQTIFETLKANRDNYVVVLNGDNDDKHPLVVGVSKELISKGIKAGDLVKKITAVTGGNGGGRPDFAQGNTIDPSKLDQVKFEF